MKTSRVISGALALCLTATAGSLVLAAPASAATYAALQVGPRPNATRIDFKVGDRVDASVDVGTGNLLVLTTDLTLPGIDKDVQLGLDYNSLLVGSSSPAATSTAGAGWGTRLGDDTKLVTNDDGSMLYLAPSGLQGVYQPTAPGASTYTSPASFKNTLVKTASGWELTDHTSDAVSIFNSTGRLTSIRDRNAQSTTFTYTSGRVSKVTSTRGGTGAKVANVTYDGNGNLMGLNQTGDTGGTRGVDYMVDPYTNPNMLQYVQDQHFFALDGQGTTEALINDDGTQTGTYNYTPYGDILNATGPGDAVGQNVYRHQLGFIDAGTGGTNWTKHGVRWNDNTTATWTTQDTVSFLLNPETGNRYLFADGDPVNNTDPTGLCSSSTGCVNGKTVKLARLKGDNSCGTSLAFLAATPLAGPFAIGGALLSGAGSVIDCGS